MAGDGPVLEPGSRPRSARLQEGFHGLGRKIVSYVAVKIPIRGIRRETGLRVPYLARGREVPPENGEPRGRPDRRETALLRHGFRERQTVRIHYRVREVVGAQVFVNAGEPTQLR